MNQQDKTQHTFSLEDLILWPDGTMCSAEELPEYNFMSNDYERIPVGTPRWEEHLSVDTPNDGVPTPRTENKGHQK